MAYDHGKHALTGVVERGYNEYPWLAKEPYRPEWITVVIC